MMCGESTIYEEGYCYTKGSECEGWYKSGNKLKNFPRTKKQKRNNKASFIITIDDNDVNANEVSSETYGKPGKYKKDQCGIQEAGPFLKSGGSWALRIMGENIL